MTHPRWKSSNEIPGSISIPFGIKTSHTWHEVGQIMRVVNDLDIETFVEIGAHVGGLGSIVSCVQKYRTFKYIGVEINPALVDESMIGEMIFLSALDRETVSLLKKLAHGKTMWYCDGGDKIKEMQVYKNACEVGDVIACHDYYEGQDVLGLNGYGVDNGQCGCKPEVSPSDLPGFEGWKPLDKYLVAGTRIRGFIK